MTKEQLIETLRVRLHRIERAITERADDQDESGQRFTIYANGELYAIDDEAFAAMQEEQAFLTGLFADLEREGVTP